VWQHVLGTKQPLYLYSQTTYENKLFCYLGLIVV
jgi:hypothetical protein